MIIKATPKIAKITPFEGREFKGKVVKTILRGKVIYNSEKGIVVQGGNGRLLRRQEHEGKFHD